MANKLKEAREKRGYSQNQLAKLTKISHSQINKFESGREMRESYIIEICKALEIKADYLLGLVDKDEK